MDHSAHQQHDAAAAAAAADDAPSSHHAAAATMTMMMPMWFTFGVDTVVWFKWWHPTSLPGYVS